MGRREGKLSQGRQTVPLRQGRTEEEERLREPKLDHVHGDFDICLPVQLSRSPGHREQRDLSLVSALCH